MLTKVIVPGGHTKFLFFAGKGGVGKSTLSAATAVWLADQGIPTLLVSTDLQRSLSDLFEREIGGQETAIPEVPGLVVRETEPERLVREHWHQLAGAVQGAFGPSEVLELMSRVEPVPVCHCANRGGGRRSHFRRRGTLTRRHSSGSGASGEGGGE